ncbi:ATP-binding protein [Lacrimispora sp. 210928-DFI.3.58]|uniref:ATP-binding protein n=1 Tax=Lacrimispora sp. 210928-DFI.3.58 TaxID=2883214 RepID=UPI001D072A1B|nr:ATP-binding protein [Lacrimispora sp. 210928-DFI.3.58]MCB7319890.1 ATP-binding protein [Lacrimispora sp. 210928-DFI.3.58]
MKYLTSVELDYMEIGDVGNLYDDVNKSLSDIIPARYTHWGIYDGNPDICALPKPYGFQAMCAVNTKLIEYDADKIKTMPLWEQRLELLKIKQLRFPMEWHDDLDNSVASALLSSYSSRKLAINEFMDDFEMKQDIKSATKSGISGSVQGLSVIGPSGVGKSCGIELITAKYPRAIFHQFPRLGYSYVQIPIILVTASANSNMGALYLSIASQIDDILGTGDMHLKRIRTLNLGRMVEVIKAYINRYHVGMIIIDEAQLIDYATNKQASFETMLTITASTGVALGIVGTEETMNKWGELLRIHRRFGTRIKADSYCSDKNYLRNIIKRIWKYQWVTPKMELTVGIIDTLVEESLGSIDMLTSIFMMMQYEIMNGKADHADVTFVKQVSNKYFKKMKELLNESITENEINFKAAREEIAKFVHDTSRKEQELERRKALEQIIAEKEQYDRDQCLRDVLNAILNCYDYTENVIKQAFVKAEKDEKFGKLSIKGKTRAVLSILEKRGTKKENEYTKAKKTDKPKTKQQDNTSLLKERLASAIEKEEVPA